jgi:putative transposase
MTAVVQAYRFELDPSNVTRSALVSHAGAARFAFNWGRRLIEEKLAGRRVLEVLALRQGAPAGEARQWAAEQVGPVPWTLAALRREWNQTKGEVAPWWRANSKEAYNSGFDALARALKGFFDTRSGARKGTRLRWPRRKKHSARRSFKVTTGSFGVIDGRHIRLPRIGVVRTKEATGKLGSRLEARAARVLSVTLSERAGRWYAAFIVETERATTRLPASGPVGVDLGVKHLAVLSTGEQVANPKHLSKWQRRQARLQAELSRRNGPATGKAPSKRWTGTKNKLAKTHAKVAFARADCLHKLTTRLAKTHSAVVVEDLNVKGMAAAGHRKGRTAKAGLNRAILDAGLGEMRRQLAYKTRWYGSSLVVADRWYPSSKTCSRCGTAKTKLPLSERTFRCESCGLVIDRDLNAAHNLASLVEAVTTGTASGAGTRQETLVNAQGETKYMDTSRCASTNCEDSTNPTGLGQTATAADQSTAA